MSDSDENQATPAQAAGLISSHLLLGGMATFGATGLFAKLWHSVKGEHRETTLLDRETAEWMQKHQRPGWTTLARGLAWSGSPPVMVGVATIGALSGLLRRRTRGAAWVFPVAIAGGGVIIQGMKMIFKRPRPSFFTPLLKETGYSFPSGHSLIAVTVYGLLGYFGQSFVQRRSEKGTVALGTGAFIGLVGASRVYVGVHYVTDVLAGWTAGVPWLITCIGLHEVMARHFKGAGEPLLPEGSPHPIEDKIMGKDSTP